MVLVIFLSLRVIHINIFYLAGKYPTQAVTVNVAYPVYRPLKRKQSSRTTENQFYLDGLLTKAKLFKRTNSGSSAKMDFLKRFIILCHPVPPEHGGLRYVLLFAWQRHSRNSAKLSRLHPRSIHPATNFHPLKDGTELKHRPHSGFIHKLNVHMQFTTMPIFATELKNLKFPSDSSRQ